MAYQGYGHGLDPEGIRRIHKDFICNYLPDLTVLLLLAPEEGLLRASHGGSKKLDRMESQNIEFHSRVFKGYQKLAEIEPERFITVDAEDSAENISAKITEEICKRLEV
jgi:dTMP kinase